MVPQVKASFYGFEKYGDKEQFLSYYNQLKMIYKANPKLMLNIGVGAKIIEKLLPKSTVCVEFDFDKELLPDVQGNIEYLPFKDNTFDLVTCFEVLEHLSFNKFENLLHELARVSKNEVILSLPFANNKFRISIFLPLIHNLSLQFLIPKFYRKHKFDGMHYWEIGKMNYSMKKIVRIIKKVFEIEERYTLPDNTYYTFFHLKKLI